MLVGRPWCQRIKLIILLSSIWIVVLVYWYQVGGIYAPVATEPPSIPIITHNAFHVHVGPPVDVVSEAQRRMDNLPVVFWKRQEFSGLKFNKSCAVFPSILDIQYNNIHWQTLNTKNGTFYLLSAFYDNRKLNNYAPTVRLVGMINRIQPTVKTYCQFWFEASTKPAFGKIFEYKYMWHPKWGNVIQGENQPYLMGCRIPSSHVGMVPVAVSVVEKQCDTAHNLLSVIFNRPKQKKPFAVCVKGLDFLHADLSLRIVEWVELLGLLGADKIFLYELQTHPNISRILQYYESTGQVSVKPLTLPGSQPNAPFIQHLYLTRKLLRKRQNEVIPYNDCFYRNLYSYDYIALLDIDEVIMPVRTRTWNELVADVVANNSLLGTIPFSSLSASNVYFLDNAHPDHSWFEDIPQHLHMLQHVYRSMNFSKPGLYVKCFHSTERVLTLHNHFPFACLGSCVRHAFPVTEARLQHYRKDCVGELEKVCDNLRLNSVLDTTIWKFKDELINRTNEVLTAVGYG